MSTTVQNSYKDLILSDGEFLANQSIVKRAKTSLCGFTNKNKCRIAAVKMLESRHFDNLIMAAILLNSIAMAYFDYHADNKCLHES
jgi:hypothetical protein